MKKRCMECKKEFLYDAYKERKYCNQKCFSASRNHRVFKNCLQCKKEFLIPKGSSQRRKYCNLKCWYDSITGVVNKRGTNVTLKGETRTLSQWCLYFNMSPASAHTRRKLGWSWEKVFHSPINVHYKMLRIYGLECSVVEWSKLMNIECSTIRQRLDRGWSDIDAVFKPLRNEKTNRDRPIMMIEINSEKLSLREWGLRVGIKGDVISRRLKLGWSPNEAVFGR